MLLKNTIKMLGSKLKMLLKNTIKINVGPSYGKFILELSGPDLFFIGIFSSSCQIYCFYCFLYEMLRSKS